MYSEGVKEKYRVKSNVVRSEGYQESIGMREVGACKARSVLRVAQSCCSLTLARNTHTVVQEVTLGPRQRRKHVIDMDHVIIGFGNHGLGGRVDVRDW